VAASRMASYEALQRYYYTLPFMRMRKSKNVLKDVCHIMGWHADVDCWSEVARGFTSERAFDEYFHSYYTRNFELYNEISPLLRSKRFKEVIDLLPKLIISLKSESLVAPFFQYLVMKRLWREGLRQCIRTSGIEGAQQRVDGIGEVLRESNDQLFSRLCNAVKDLKNAEEVLKKEWSDSFKRCMDLVRARGLMAAKVKDMESDLSTLELGCWRAQRERVALEALPVTTQSLGLSLSSEDRLLMDEFLAFPQRKGQELGQLIFKPGDCIKVGHWLSLISPNRMSESQKIDRLTDARRIWKDRITGQEMITALSIVVGLEVKYDFSDIVAQKADKVRVLVPEYFTNTYFPEKMRKTFYYDLVNHLDTVGSVKGLATFLQDALNRSANDFHGPFILYMSLILAWEKIEPILEKALGGSMIMESLKGLRTMFGDGHGSEAMRYIESAQRSCG